MKYLIVFLLLSSAVALDQDFIDKFMERATKIGEECAAETNASDDDIAELIEGNRPSTHEGKCMIFCFQKKLHMMNEDGTVDKVGCVLALDELRDADFELYKKVLMIFVTCGEREQPHDDPCVTATSLAMCAKEEAVKANIDVTLFG